AGRRRSARLCCRARVVDSTVGNGAAGGSAALLVRARPKRTAPTRRAPTRRASARLALRPPRHTCSHLASASKRERRAADGAEGTTANAASATLQVARRLVVPRGRSFPT